jgi:hypothetical protein
VVGVWKEGYESYWMRTMYSDDVRSVLMKDSTCCFNGWDLTRNFPYPVPWTVSTTVWMSFSFVSHLLRTFFVYFTANLLWLTD